jgi:hypothetical protein
MKYATPGRNMAAAMAHLTPKTPRSPILGRINARGINRPHVFKSAMIMGGIVSPMPDRV